MRLLLRSPGSIFWLMVTAMAETMKKPIMIRTCTSGSFQLNLGLVVGA
jgi:hypothetical protein